MKEVAELAPLWGRLANCIKGEQVTIMTQELQRVCLARGVSAELYTPVITNTLKQMITGFQFVGHGVDDLTTGCLPYLVAYSGSTHHQQKLANTSISLQLAHGDQTASLADYRTLRDKEKVKFPRNTMDVCISLTRFAILCQTLFQGGTGQSAGGSSLAPYWGHAKCGAVRHGAVPTNGAYPRHNVHLLCKYPARRPSTSA